MSKRAAMWPAVIIIVTLSGISTAECQNYPSKPIRIVTSGAGGSPDFVARLVGIGLTDAWGQQVIVDNRPSGVIPGDTAAKSAPDGYTLLVTSGILWTGPLLSKTPYDPVADFQPITLAGILANILVVHPSLPVKSVKDLIALAKSRPGKLNYASSSAGSSSQLAAELFKAMAGVDIVRVNYKGANPALTAIITGEVQMAFGNAASVTPHMKSGRLHALAVGTSEPSAMAPELPTVAAAGLPGYESAELVAIFAPAKTPAAIVSRLNQEMVRILATSDVKTKCFNVGVEVVGSSPDQLAARIKTEMARLGQVIKDAGIRAE